MKFLLKNCWIFLFVMVAGMVVVSCGDDDEEPTVLDRDKFIGDYIGSFQCPGVFATAGSDTIEFNISASIDPDDMDGVIITIKNILMLDLALDATVMGNKLVDINTVLPGTPFGEVTGSGEAELSADETTLTADISLTADIPILGTQTETCRLDGAKQ